MNKLGLKRMKKIKIKINWGKIGGKAYDLEAFLCKWGGFFDIKIKNKNL